MPRLRVSDLQLTGRAWPVLVRASYNTGLLHISVHNGLWKNPSESKYASDRYFVVTKCKRPFENDVGFPIGIDKLSNYQLCSRCGTLEDFEAALEDYKAGRAAQRLERQKEEEERRAKAQRDAEVRAQLASKIASFLNYPPLFEAHADNGKVFVQYEGVLYRLPVMEERER